MIKCQSPYFFADNCHHQNKKKINKRKTSLFFFFFLFYFLFLSPLVILLLYIPIIVMNEGIFIRSNDTRELCESKEYNQYISENNIFLKKHFFFFQHFIFISACVRIQESFLLIVDQLYRKTLLYDLHSMKNMYWKINTFFFYKYRSCLPLYESPKRR